MTTIVIGLDSAEPTFIEALMASNELPNMQRIRAEGAYGLLDNFDVYTAELPWTTFATGAMPARTGYWTPLKYHTNYDVTTRAAYEYDDYQAFYALGKEYKVCSFDVPQVRLQKNLNGLQINAWGAHSPQVDQEANQPHELEALLQKHGRHPGLHCDYAHVLNMSKVRRVYEVLMDGIQRRGNICVDLLDKESWDLFVTVFGEPHGGGHNFWQFLPDHPLHEAEIPGQEMLPENPLKNIMIAIDSAIGKIVDSAPENANIVVFSAHGMGPNTMDLPSTFFLPEMMYRYHFNQPALGVSVKNNAVVTKQIWGNWERHVWNTASRGNLFVRALRRVLPTRWYNRLEPYFEVGSDDFPLNPHQAYERYHPRPWFQTTLWYAHLWKDMKAFALPSFSDGYVRINLKGREKNGIVNPEDFPKVIREVSEFLSGITCSRTGIKMVKRLEHTRVTGFETDPKLPDADIVIVWQEEFATDSVEHTDYGKIGPVPHFRAGSHRHTGFIMAKGPAIKAGHNVVGGHALDIAPTILSLMGIKRPEYMEGKPLSSMFDLKINDDPKVCQNA